jgi:hypothetical protein
MSDDAKSAMDGFGKYVPGFEFLQNLAGQGDAARPSLSSLGNWVAPTFNVEDLDKRIEELKAVQFWLDQNAKALAATIQALEVQKMTLTTLKTMNLSMGDVAQSIGAMVGGMAGGAEAAPAPAPTVFAGLEIAPRTYGNSPAPAAARDSGEAEAEDEADDAPADAQPSAAPRASAAAGSAAGGAAGGAVDPMQWWGALTQQFQQIASKALQDASRQVVPGTGDAPANSGRFAPAPQTRQNAAATTPAQKTSTRKAPARKAAAKKPVARQAPTKTASPTTHRASKAVAPQTLGGDWPMPTAFFQMPGFPGVGEPQKSAPKKSTSTKTSAASTRKPAAKKSPARKAAPANRRR